MSPSSILVQLVLLFHFCCCYQKVSGNETILESIVAASENPYRMDTLAISFKSSNSSRSLQSLRHHRKRRPLRPDPKMCLILSNSTVCSAFSNSSVPTSLFKSVSDFDAFVLSQIQLELDRLVQNCTNAAGIQSVKGLTTQVCHFALMVFWRTYQCGQGGLFGVGCPPPVLCQSTCETWVNGYNALVPLCLVAPGKQKPPLLNVTTTCRSNPQAIADGASCISEPVESAAPKPSPINLWAHFFMVALYLIM